MVSSLFVNQVGSSKLMVSGLIQELKIIIMDAKGESGITGLTQKKPALVHWTLTHHLLGAYSATIRDQWDVGQGVHSAWAGQASSP